MKLILESEISEYYVQTLCLIFFPGSKFRVDEEITDDTPVVFVKTEKEEDHINAYVTVTVGEVTTFGTHSQAISSRISYERAMKIAVGKAVFEAGEQYTEYTPAWGILTGIRPAKISGELLRSGMSEAQVRKTLRNEYFLNPKKASLLTAVSANEERIIAGVEPDECSLYISIPFCPTRCAYCSFVSFSTKRLLSMIPDYLVRLLEDLEMVFGLIKEYGLKLKTVYIGGGTPTTLTAEQLSLIFDKIDEHIDVSTLSEFTLEAGRPDTVTAEKLTLAVNRGVTRVSINPQTLNDEVLERIGRKHTVEDFYKAFDLAREAGVKYINTDLIAGLPGDSYKSFSKSVDSILKLRPENITIHSFSIKKAAELAGIAPELYSITGGEAFKSVEYSQMKSKIAGYIPYYIYRQKNTVGNLENVGFALPGAEGLYNIYIMEEVTHIFAVGAGSVTKLVNRAVPTIERVFMPKYPYEYLSMTKENVAEQYVAKIRAFMSKNYGK
jgi:oxygen-independent coproporphyrinogen-3 oxidase